MRLVNTSPYSSIPEMTTPSSLIEAQKVGLLVLSVLSRALNVNSN